MFLIHPTAWKKNSANLAFTEFSEVDVQNGAYFVLCGYDAYVSSGEGEAATRRRPCLTLAAKLAVMLLWLLPGCNGGMGDSGVQRQGRLVRKEGVPIEGTTAPLS
jgi:hypothetical protein